MPEETWQLPEAEAAERRMLEIYEAAYVGWDAEGTLPDSPHAPDNVLHPAQIDDDAFLRHWKPRNYLAKVVEEPLGYLLDTEPQMEVITPTGEPLSAEDDAESKQISAIVNWFELKVRPRLRDLILWQGLYGWAFAKPAYEPANEEFGRPADLHIIPYPRWEEGGERANAFFEDDDPDRITLGVVFWSKLHVVDEERGETERVRYAQLLKRDEIVWLTKESGAWKLWLDGSATGTGRDPHNWGVVPLAVLYNDGKPDIHDGLETQEVINRDIYDMNALSHEQSFPQRYRKGLIPHGGWPVDPMTGAPQVVEPLDSGPGVLWDVPENGEVGQLAAADGSFLLDKLAEDKHALALLCRSLAVDMAGNSHGTVASGESKHMDAENLLSARLEGKAEMLSAFCTDLLAVVKEMALKDPAIAKVVPREMLDFTTRVRFELEIGRDKNRERELDQADRNGGSMSLYTYLRHRGFTPQEANKEIERIGEERTAEQERQQQVAANDPLNQVQANARAAGSRNGNNRPRPGPPAEA